MSTANDTNWVWIAEGRVQTGHATTHRMRVRGGYVYREVVVMAGRTEEATDNVTVALVFVPYAANFVDPHLKL